MSTGETEQPAPNNGFRQFSKRLKRNCSLGDHSPAWKGSQSVSPTVALLDGSAIRSPARPRAGTLSHGSVVVLTRQRRLPFLHVLPTLVEDLLDIVGPSYDGIDFRATPKDQAPERQTACARRRQLL